MPKKSPELRRLLQAITAEEVEGTDSTRLELLARQLVALAMAGDSMALREILNRYPDEAQPEHRVEVHRVHQFEPKEIQCHSSQDSIKTAI